MSEKVKLIIEIPKEDYLNAKRINWANIRPEYVDDYEYQIAHGIPLDDIDSDETKAYFDGQAYGWEEGRKALIDDVKAEIKTFTIAEKSKYDRGFNEAVLKCFNALDNIGKGDEECQE